MSHQHKNAHKVLFYNKPKQARDIAEWVDRILRKENKTDYNLMRHKIDSGLEEEARDLFTQFLDRDIESSPDNGDTLHYLITENKESFGHANVEAQLFDNIFRKELRQEKREDFR